MNRQNQDVANAIRNRLPQLSESTAMWHYQRMPGLMERHGAVGTERCLQDCEYHFSYLSEAIEANDPGLFQDYMRWARELFDSIGFEGRSILDILTAMRASAERYLAPEHVEILTKYLDSAEKDQRTQGAASQASDVGNLSELAEQYLRLLLAGRRHDAALLVDDEMRRGATIRDLYLNVFQPAQRRIGQLWQQNQVSVAQEHYCTAATQLIIARLYPLVFNTPRNGLRMLAACTSGELHELGIRMVADFFELDGWDTYYVGANTPNLAVVQAAQQHKPHLIALSATMTFHINRLRAIIKALRSDPQLASVPIMVGGYPFNASPQLWQSVGADGYGSDADTAIQEAHKLVARGAA